MSKRLLKFFSPEPLELYSDSEISTRNKLVAKSYGGMVVFVASSIEAVVGSFGEAIAAEPPSVKTIAYGAIAVASWHYAEKQLAKISTIDESAAFNGEIHNWLAEDPSQGIE